MRKKPDIIAFDLDGTLTKPGKIGTFAACYAEQAVAQGLVLAHHFFRAAKVVKRVIFPQIFLSAHFKKAVLGKVAEPREGVSPMIEKIRGKGIQTLLVSNNSRIAWGNRLRRHFDFGPDFDGTLFREDMKGRVKPDPKPILELIDRISDKKTEQTIWVVGDMKKDMEMAIRANSLSGHTFIPVAMGERSPAAAFVKMCGELHGALIVGNCHQLLQQIEIACDTGNHTRSFDNPRRRLMRTI